MTSATAAPLSPAALLDQQGGDAQHYRALLHELMDVGMGFVRAVREQAAAETGGEEMGAPAALREAAVTFDKTAKMHRWATRRSPTTTPATLMSWTGPEAR